MPLCKITRTDFEVMRAMRAENMTYQAISAAIGVHHSTVRHSLLNTRKLPFHDPAPTTQQLVTRLRSIADKLENTL